MHRVISCNNFLLDSSNAIYSRLFLPDIQMKRNRVHILSRGSLQLELLQYKKKKTNTRTIRLLLLLLEWVPYSMSFSNNASHITQTVLIPHNKLRRNKFKISFSQISLVPVFYSGEDVVQER